MSLIFLVSRNPTAGASIGEPRALTYTSRTAYVSYAQVYHPPYALNPYDRSRNILQTPRIHIFCSHCPRPVTLYCAFLSPTLSLQPILHLCNTAGAAKSSVFISYFTLYFQRTYNSKTIFLISYYAKFKEKPNTYT